MKPSAAQLRQLKRDNMAYPVAARQLDPSEWPATVAGVGAPTAVWRSRTHLVQLFDDRGHMRLSINRTDWDERAARFRDDISWDDLQRLKAECGFGQQAAVEVYPPDAHVVNVANMRHLWLLPEPPAFMWGAKR